MIHYQRQQVLLQLIRIEQSIDFQSSSYEDKIDMYNKSIFCRGLATYMDASGDPTDYFFFLKDLKLPDYCNSYKLLDKHFDTSRSFRSYLKVLDIYLRVLRYSRENEQELVTRIYERIAKELNEMPQSIKARFRENSNLLKDISLEEIYRIVRWNDNIHE